MRSGKRLQRPALRVEKLIELLAKYESATPGKPAPLKAFNELQESYPELDFPTRSEPRTVIRQYLVTRQKADRVSFERDIVTVLKSDQLELLSLMTLVSILEEGHFEFPVSAMYEVVNRIDGLPLNDIVDQVIADTVALVERRDPADLFALLHRLSSQRAARPAALLAALQAVAQHNPAAMGEVFRTFGKWILDPALDTNVLAIWLTEVSRLSGPIALLMSLRALPTATNGKLLLAAFGFDSSPFTMSRVIGNDPDAQRIEVLWQGEAISLSAVDPRGDHDTWLAQISAAMRNITRDLKATQPSTSRLRKVSVFESRELGRPTATGTTTGQPWNISTAWLEKFKALSNTPVPEASFI
mgnify:CR=1 FL=1